jgi:catechol 2,3-dioxygenase-like lactoylglutathione lyase family enzyme
MKPTYDVGGVHLERPYRVLRLGHFGFNVKDQEPALRFYSDLLGLATTDRIDFGRFLNVTGAPGQDPNGYFLRVGADHHAVVLFPHWVFAGRGPKFEGTEYVSHMAWQVASMREVVEGLRWATDEKKLRLVRPAGRDAPGANWNFTIADADHIANEIYYGMDQIGWDGISKPAPIFPRGDTLPEPDGAIAPDYPMARSAIEAGLDLRLGLQARPFGTPAYNVDGTMLPRPFHIVRNGPIRIFAQDVAAATAFYREIIGLTVTETIVWNGHECVFLRANTEHHTIGLYPRALRNELGMRNDSICMAYGMQVANYRQLKDAVVFLKENGVTVRYLPPELSPGIDYSAFAVDPDGNAIQLYYYMEQIGWDGRPRPVDLRPKVDNASWPESIEPLSDTYNGTAFQGPAG